VFLQAGELRQMREVSLTSGFSGQSDRRLHFGLGSRDGTVDVLIRWPGGGSQEIHGLTINAYHTITFGSPFISSTGEATP
jgi:hypothetical protein